MLATGSWTSLIQLAEESGRILTVRAKLRLLLLATLFSTPLTAIAQESEFPTLNTIGRFLGVGYSHTGYHGRRDGRFDAIQNRHPASNYGSGALLYPYDPGYRPVRPMRMPAAGTLHSTPRIAPAMPKIAPPQPATEAEQIDTPDPTPPKPTVPPPQWLKPHLKQPGPDQSQKQVEPRNEVFGELTPPRPPSSQAESPFFLEPASPSDRPERGDALGGPRADQARQDSLLSDDLLGDDPLGDDLLGPANDASGQGGESLLEDGGRSILNDADDDELLLLDDDDLSARRYQRPTTAEPRTATQPSNRRKVSILQGAIPSSRSPSPSPNTARTQAGFVDYRQPQQLATTPQTRQYPAQQRFTAPPRQPNQYRVQTVRPAAPVVRYYGAPPRTQANPQRVPIQLTVAPQGMQPRGAPQQQARPSGSPGRVAAVPGRVVSYPARRGAQLHPTPAPQAQPLQWQTRPIRR